MGAELRVRAVGLEVDHPLKAEFVVVRTLFARQADEVAHFLPR